MICDGRYSVNSQIWSCGMITNPVTYGNLKFLNPWHHGSSIQKAVCLRSLAEEVLRETTQAPWTSSSSPCCQEHPRHLLNFTLSVTGWKDQAYPVPSSWSSYEKAAAPKGTGFDENHLATCTCDSCLVLTLVGADSFVQNWGRASISARSAYSVGPEPISAIRPVFSPLSKIRIPTLLNALLEKGGCLFLQARQFWVLVDIVAISANSSEKPQAFISFQT